MSEFNIDRASIWPNVIFDTTSADGMAAAQAWVTGLVPERPVDESSDANSTPTHRNPNRATRDTATHPGLCRCSGCLRRDRVLYGITHELPPPDPLDRVEFVRAGVWAGLIR